MTTSIMQMGGGLNKQMKVLQLVPSIRAESSGPSYSVPGLCRGLSSNGVRVDLHFLGDVVPNHLQDAAYRIVNYQRRDCLNLGFSRAMREGLRAACRSADIIHNNSLWMMPNVYPAWAVKGTKCKLVVAPRGTLAAWSLRKGWLKKKIFGWLFQNAVLRRADMFHATSEKEYEEIRALGYKQPVAIVPIGMEIPAFERSNVQTFGHSPRWGTPGLKKVVFFGRLHKVKAVDRLIQAWEILAQSTQATVQTSTTTQGNSTISPRSTRPSDELVGISRVEHVGHVEGGAMSSWELVIAGPDNGIRGELEAYIAEHKIPRVRFVGEINGPAKYEFLSAADLYVLPSHTENFGVTVAEALACKTPVVVSKGTPWSGVVENGCGKWVDNSPESLATAIGELMKLSTDERREMGEHGREWIRRDFSWEGVGAKMKAAYEWLLDPAGVDRPEWVRID